MLATSYIRFATDSGGAGEYVLPINPYNVTGFVPDRTESWARHLPVDGTQRYTVGALDRQEKVLYFRVRSDRPILMGLYTELKSYEGQTKYFKDGIIGAYTAWTAMRVVSVERDVMERYLDGAVVYSVIVRLKRT